MYQVRGSFSPAKMEWNARKNFCPNHPLVFLAPEIFEEKYPSSSRKCSYLLQIQAHSCGSMSVQSKPLISSPRSDDVTEQV